MFCLGTVVFCNPNLIASPHFWDKVFVWSPFTSKNDRETNRFKRITYDRRETFIEAVRNVSRLRVYFPRQLLPLLVSRAIHRPMQAFLADPPPQPVPIGLALLFEFPLGKAHQKRP